MSFASESGHWYTRTGEPMYEVPKKDGSGLRPTTLRDARQLGLVPSVTTIMKGKAAPQLEMWKIKEAIYAARKMRKRKDETEEQFAIRAYNQSQQQVRDRAALGSKIHGALEKYFLGNLDVDPEYEPYVEGVCDALFELDLLDEQFLAEKSFAYYGFGGKVDLHSPNLVIDFKTKEFDEDHLPRAYDNHAMQLGAYRVGLDICHATGLILFVSVDNPGLVHPVWLYDEELRKGYLMFDALRRLWCAERGYNPNEVEV